MKSTILTLALLFPTSVCAGDTKMEMGMYVTVSDVTASTQSYSDLFQTVPFIEIDTFGGFQVNRGRFGLM